MIEEVKRKKSVIIDVTNIYDERDFHELLKKELGFPEFYGMNWGAFWDAITGLVELPEVITFQGFDSLKRRLPEAAGNLMKYFTYYNEWEPLDKTEVIYK